MKRYLIEIGRFLIVFILFIVLISCLNKKIFSLFLSESYIKLDKKIITIITGDSHTQTSLDPAYINNSINISQSAEPYIYSYYKLKFIIENNPQIENVVLGCSFNNFSGYQEFNIFNSKKEEFYKRYFLLLDNEGISKIKNASSDFIIAYFKYKLGIPITMKGNFKNYFKLLSGKFSYSDYPFWGSYYKIDKSYLDSVKISIKICQHFYKNNEIYETSIIQKEYLNKILKLCEENNITLYTYNSPLHEIYIDQIPEQMKILYYSIIDELNKNSKKIIHIDNFNIPLIDSVYADGDHLNNLGAKIVSNQVDSLLNCSIQF